MSAAAKCDGCGAVFAWQRGCVTIEAMHVVSKAKRDGNECATWTEIDFCPKCSPAVIAATERACTGMKRFLR